MEIVICSITQKKKIEDTVLGKSIEKMGDFTFDMQTNNSGKDAVGLPEYYNKCLNKYSDVDYIVFVHDDVDIINSDLLYQVHAGLKSYDVIGVAGCINPKIIERNLWHWMAQDMKNCRGIAGHPSGSGDFYVTTFGPTPNRVAILDGVFLAVNVGKIINSGTLFDEQFKFHHYDIDFSLTCNQNKLKLGVWPILINHQSPGLKDFSDDWNNSNEKFINKWKNK